MLQLNAQTLRDKRELIINQSLNQDYEDVLKSFTEFFSNEDNLLVEFPEIGLTTKYAKTKERLITEFTENGFFVISSEDNYLLVSLYDKFAKQRQQKESLVDSVEIKDSLNDASTIPEVPKEEPKVVVKQPTYSHTDLQMSGGSPF